MLFLLATSHLYRDIIITIYNICKPFHILPLLRKDRCYEVLWEKEDIYSFIHLSTYSFHCSSLPLPPWFPIWFILKKTSRKHHIFDYVYFLCLFFAEVLGLLYSLFSHSVSSVEVTSSTYFYLFSLKKRFCFIFDINFIWRHTF